MAALSLKYRLIRKAVRLLGIKKTFQQPPEVLLERARREAVQVRIPHLEDARIRTEVREIGGAKVVVLMHREQSARACLFLIGGGMSRHPRPSAVKKALKMALATGRDMIVPYYPLCIDGTIDRTYEMLYTLYQRLLEDYQPEKLMIAGSSSGANLSLGLISHIHAMGDVCPLPEKVYASSPGECIDREEIREKAEALNAKDVVIDVKYMDSAKAMMTKGKDMPPYMLYLEDGHYRGLREVYLCYGSDEVLYAACDPVVQALKRDGVRVRLEIGKGMFHCYPFFPMVRESKEAWDRMIAYIRE